MSGRPLSKHGGPTLPVEEILDRARKIASKRTELTKRVTSEVNCSDLLLAVMACPSTQGWARLIADRGGLGVKDAIRRLNCPELAEVIQAPADHIGRYRPSLPVRLVIGIRLVVSFVARLFGWTLDRHSKIAPDEPQLSASACKTLDDASTYARRAHLRGQRPSHEVVAGGVLLALATRPGRHLCLLTKPELVAAAVRLDLGIGVRGDRFVVGLDGLHLRRRRFAAWLQGRADGSKRLSAWSIANRVSRATGDVIGAFWLAFEIVASVGLYLFLWPALLLFTGFRHLAAALGNVEVSSRRWWDVPGGELVCNGGSDERPTSRTLTFIVLAPRSLAFASCVVAMFAVGRGMHTLGIVPVPELFARPDLLAGVGGLAGAPLAILGGFTGQYGALGGLGLLAGLGCGLLAIPTGPELETLRRQAGHSRGHGSRIMRPVLGGASLLAQASASLETFLSLQGGPIYLTVYAVPFICAVLLATLGVTAVG